VENRRVLPAILQAFAELTERKCNPFVCLRIDRLVSENVRLEYWAIFCFLSSEELPGISNPREGLADKREA
jgi:hypothetical protein